MIGEALLLTKQIRTVVNKTSTIDNTYRNFAMELLAGEKDFQGGTKQNIEKGKTISGDGEGEWTDLRVRLLTGQCTVQ